MQFLPDIFTLAKEFGIAIVLAAFCFYLLYLIIRYILFNKAKKVFSDHDIAIEQINENTKSIRDPKDPKKTIPRSDIILISKELLNRFEDIAEQMEKRCELSDCHYFDDILEICNKMSMDLTIFVEGALKTRQDTKEKITESVKLIVEKIDEGNKSNKELNQSLLGLVKSFIEKTLNNHARGK